MQSISNKDERLISSNLKLRFFPIEVASAIGCEIQDIYGKTYIDLTAGWGVMNIGYGNERVGNALKKQYEKLSFTTQLSAPSYEMLELAECLIGLTPGNFEKKVWFGHSGSDANEFIYKSLPKATGKNKIISFIGAYHGQTIGAATMSGHSAQSIFPSMNNVVKIPYPNLYRPFSGISEGLTSQIMVYLQEVLNTIAPFEDVAAIIVEPIQSDAGVIIPPEDFLISLQNICQEHQIYLIADEVKVGMGRTGKWFSFEHVGIIPDAVVLGKSLGGGLPISAVVGRKEIMDSMTAGHMFTTSGNPICTRAALETIAIIQDDNLIDNAKVQGEYFLNCLKQLQTNHPLIGDVRGRGLAIGIELVEDINKKPAVKQTASLAYLLYEKGVLAYPVGLYGNVLEMTPPLTIQRDLIDRVIKKIDEALSEIELNQFDEKKLSNFMGWG